MASPAPLRPPRLQAGDLARTGALAQQRKHLSQQRLPLPSAHLPAQLQRHQQFGQRLAVEDAAGQHGFDEALQAVDRQAVRLSHRGQRAGGLVLLEGDRKSTRLNSRHKCATRMTSSAWKKKSTKYAHTRNNTTRIQV